MTDTTVLMAALGTERKAFELEIKDLTDEGTFSGYAAVYGNVDLGNDLIETGAFTKSVAERPRVPILSSHVHPIGVGDLAEEGHGLLVKGRLTMSVQAARETHALMKDGAIGGLSIGYRAVKKAVSGRVRYLKEVAVKEVSLVTFPMNELALVGDVKSAELAGLLAGVLRRLRDEDPEAVKALLAELEPGSSPLDRGAADTELEPAIATRLQYINDGLKELCAK